MEKKDYKILTHAFEYKKLAYAGYLLDFFANLGIAVSGAILFYQFEFQTTQAFVLLVFGTISATHVDIFEAWKIQHFDRP